MVRIAEILSVVLERWLSGQKRRLGKSKVGLNPAHEFESHSLRIMKTIIIKKTNPAFIERVKNQKAEAKIRHEETFTKVPPIHWEILRYHNHHTKDETIAAYPEYKEFIGTIR